MLDSEKCNHDWSYSDSMKMSMPPQQDRICRKCGREETVRHEMAMSDFESVKNKFGGRVK